MNLTIRLFARARDLAGSELVEVDISPPGRVFELKQSLASQIPQLSPLVANLLVAVGTNYADDQTVLLPTDEIACFPPVSGG